VTAVAVLLALVHAVLATVPKRAVRGRHAHPKFSPSAGGNTTSRWLLGDDEGGQP
jgi:hypothetical protein